MTGGFDTREVHRDATPPDAPLSSLHGLLRQGLRFILEDGHLEQSSESSLRTSLRDACGRARRDGVRAEQVIVSLKKAWREVPERLRVPQHDADQVLARVVTACINEYYEDRSVRDTRLFTDRVVRYTRFDG